MQVIRLWVGFHLAVMIGLWVLVNPWVMSRLFVPESERSRGLLLEGPRLLCH